MKTQHIENLRGQVMAFLDGKNRICALPEPISIEEADALDIDESDLVDDGPGRARVARTRPRVPATAEDLHQAEATLADGLAAGEA